MTPFTTSSHVAILHRIYGELVDSPWELSGASEFPAKDRYFSPTVFNGFWVSIDFGVHPKESIFTQSASLKLYDPSQEVGGASGIIIELKAFDAPQFSQSGIQVFLPKNLDPKMGEWSDLLIEHAQALKRKAVFNRIRELLVQRVTYLQMEDQLVELGSS